jgi:hypothetical protein
MAILGTGGIIGFSANAEIVEKYSQSFGNTITTGNALYSNINVYTTVTNNAITMSNVVSVESAVVTTFGTVSNLIPMTANVQNYNEAVIKNSQQVSKEQTINRVNYRPNFNY